MAEANKICQDAAKATIKFIENNTRGSSKASRNAVITRVDDSGKALKYVALKVATAGGAASTEAGNRGDKRKAEEPPLFAGVAPRVAKLATAAEHGRVGMALKTEQANTPRGSSHAVGDSVAVKSAVALLIQSIRSKTLNRRPASTQSDARSLMQRRDAGWNRPKSVGVSNAWMRWLNFDGSAITDTLALRSVSSPGADKWTFAPSTDSSLFS